MHLQQQKKKYRYLLWDIDGTVLDFAVAEKAAVKALFKQFDFGPCTDEMVAIYSAINDKYWHALEYGEMTKPEVLVGRFREFFSLYGLPQEKAATFNELYQAELGNTIAFCDEADKLLLSLKSRYVQAAVTNGTKIAQKKKLSRSGLDAIFDYIFISEDVGTEKPGAAFFDHVERRMGIEDKNEVLIIGDSMTSDILGGLRAGYDTCLYNPRGRANDKPYAPMMQIRSIQELKFLLA